MGNIYSFDDENINEVYEYVGEWELWIGLQKIMVRIKKDQQGNLFHNLSYHYWGSDQMGPYHSSVIGPYENIEDAIRSAKRELLFFYNPNDNKAKWVKDENY